MTRAIVFVSLLFVTMALPATTLHADASGPPLVADAGNSRLVVDATSAPVTGQAFGGVAPYTFHWTLDGDHARFTDASAASTSVNLTGLGPGAVDLTLTVTDADGTLATDTVRYKLDDVGERLHTFTGTAGPGAPFLVLADHLFDVPAGLAALRVTLAWEGQLEDAPIEDDLDLVVERHNGNQAGASTTTDNPEVVLVTNVVDGQWRAQAIGWLSGPVAYTITVDAFPLVEVRHNGPYLFGADDDRTLAAQAFGDGVSVAWDTDGDGVFETAGASPTLGLSAGSHDVRVRATTADGYRVTKTTTVTVEQRYAHNLALVCGELPSRPYKPMELSIGQDTCWHHGGHHTYFLGQGGKAWTLVGGTARLVAVEIAYSPPSETTLPNGTASLTIETSLDGQVWNALTLGEAHPLGAVREAIDVSLSPTNEPFRYLRIHQPRSFAQGLSGFLDASRLDLQVDEAAFDPAPASEGTRTSSCDEGAVMEDFFADHPCWFGGINRYDAPSFVHTYVVGEGAALATISGHVQVAPWRTDDWFRPVTTDPADITTTHVLVQTSQDGIAWTTQHTVAADHGVTTPFDVTLPSVPATFVRLVPEPHRLFDQHRDEPSLHHPEAFLVDSALTLDGTLPPT